MRQLEGERRHLTVLFCDLADSTAIASRMDPEDWRAIVAACHNAAAQAITRYGGHVAKYLGDGLMAFFGYPEAHENGAEDAVRAGLAIISTLADLNASVDHQRLAARVGIDSGAVVVGAGAGREADVFGDTPNIAARVQAAAEPGTVLVSDNTFKLISGLFVVKDRSAQPLKGFTEPLNLYRVLRPSAVRGRLQALAASRGLTPFVGRAAELRILTDRWERAREGNGQAVLIIGEPGIGKSRLLHRFHETLVGEPYTWLDGAARIFFQNTPFHPVLEMLRETLFPDDESPPDALARIASSLTQAGLDPADAIPLLAPMLNFPLPPAYSSSSLAPDLWRRRLLKLLVEWILGTARHHPLIIATEDLHWADPSTLELIQLLATEGNAAPLLLLFTARPEFTPQWPRRAHHTQIKLNGLSTNDVRGMVAQVSLQKILAEETVKEVVSRTAGIPLFVEELTRAVLESGAPRMAGHTIPATLRDSLMARLDKLGAARETLQVGAVLGGEFTYFLLQAVLQVDNSDLQRHLRTLADAELLYVRGIAPNATYQFKHALIRDAAYEALLKSRRRDFHRRVSETLVERFPDVVAAAPELAAHHYSEAGLPDLAIRYWRKAGRSASDRSAYPEAIAHFNQALEAIKALPATQEWLTEELRLQIALTGPLTATKGYTGPEVQNACDRAFELYQQLGEGPQLFPMLGRLYSVYANRGDFSRSLALAREMLRIAQVQKEPLFSLWAHYCTGHTLSMQGDLELARTHMEQCLALYDFDQRREYHFVQDPGATGLALLAHVLHSCGYPDQALARSSRALAHARALSQPYTTAWVLGSVGGIHAFRREFAQAEKLWAEQIALCTEHNFSWMLAIGIAGNAWAMAELGRGDEALARIREGLGTFSGDATPEHALNLSHLARALMKLGQAQEAFGAVNEALQLVEKTQASVFAAHLYSLKGMMLLAADVSSNTQQAEYCFRVAIDVARTLHARGSELQATTILARILRDTGRGTEARTMLSAIFDWFTEGFATPDLIDAKALLTELGA